MVIRPFPPTLCLMSLLLVALFSAAAAAAEEWTPGRIAIPQQASPTERFAAGELQKYIKKIADEKLPISRGASGDTGGVLLIGRTPTGQKIKKELKDADPEAFTVRTTGEEKIALVGASDRGTLYAVYDFLERDLGCRWLGPGPLWEEIPERKKITVGSIDRTQTPGIQFRMERMIQPGDPGSWDHYTTSWAIKNRINLVSDWPEDDYPAYLRKRGGARAWWSTHAIGYKILPTDKYYKQHPELYALVDGERRDNDGRTQLCTTYTRTVDRTTRALREQFDARPDLDQLPLTQADGTAFCQCPQCTALDTGERWHGTYSGEGPVITERWLSFVNRVARRIQESHPGKKLYTLAYHQTFRPPDPERIQPEPNVMIVVVNSRPNYLCFVHRLTNPDCPRNARFREGLEKWLQITPGGVGVYQYIRHSSFISMPYPAVYKFVDDIRYLHDQGVVAYEGQVNNQTWGTYGILNYAVAKATWNPDIDAEALVRDYTEHAFHKAAEPMRHFYRTIERGLREADHAQTGVWSYLTPGLMARAREHLDAAHAAAEGDDTAQRRLRSIEIGFHFGELTVPAWRLGEKAMEGENDPRMLAEAIRRGKTAVRYLDQQSKNEPHHAASPNQLLKRISLWKRWLRETRQKNSN